MFKFLQLIAILMLSAGIAAAQSKGKTLTMDDVAPAEPKAKETAPASNAAASNNELERGWQDRVNEAEMKVLNAQLRNAFDDKNSETILDLKKKEAQLNELKDDGSKRGFTERRSNEVYFRERYVKLRIEMIKEAKLHPDAKSTESQTIYVKSSKGSRKPRGVTGQKTPFTEKKEIAGKRTKFDQLADEIEDLEEEGRRAGVGSGVFQD